MTWRKTLLRKSDDMKGEIKEIKFIEWKVKKYIAVEGYSTGYFFLYVADLSSIPGTMYGSLSHVRIYMCLYTCMHIYT